MVFPANIVCAFCFFLNFFCLFVFKYRVIIMITRHYIVIFYDNICQIVFCVLLTFLGFLFRFEFFIFIPSFDFIYYFQLLLFSFIFILFVFIYLFFFGFCLTTLCSWQMCNILVTFSESTTNGLNSCKLF